MLSDNYIKNLRRSYSFKELSKSTVFPNPFAQFSSWMDEVINSKILDPNAMTLSTSNKTGMPSSRIVLLRGFDEKGFVFYSNYKSSKAKDLDENPLASLLFFWAELERQVRIKGKVEKISKAESEKYFESRPRGHQLGAWASEQSTVIENRKVLEKQFDEVERRFKDKKVSMPSFWGGYKVIPFEFEF